MKKNKNLLCSLLIGASFIATSGVAMAKAKGTLVSKKTSAPIVLDAYAEAAWDSAKALSIRVTELPYKPNNGYSGMKRTNVSIKSLHDKYYVYFMIQWDDPTKSLERFPWVKQADGSWKQSVAKDSTGHDNTFYEDKLGIYWNINADGFEKKGCDVSCHLTENGMNNGFKDKSAGRKYTKPGQTIDMWHWKGVRTNPLGLFDDQYVDDMAYPVKDGKKNKSWGRHGDSKDGGGYKNNKTKDGKMPMYMNSPYSEEYKYMVVPWQRAKFVDNFKAGDVVPGINLDAFYGGNRSDIKVKGAWKEGKWTLEVKRALKTRGKNSKIQDVQFNNKKKSYYFGISVFDNSQINHIYHEGSYKMVFR
ncbi:MAG: ethylbenzene dehydrogenase [Proteobacteria bacterium]|nr:ethylbenzene dehydrogenase [Pseudomonadota bacterium]